MNERRGVEWYDGKKGYGLVDGYDKGEVFSGWRGVDAYD